MTMRLAPQETINEVLQSLAAVTAFGITSNFNLKSCIKKRMKTLLIACTLVAVLQLSVADQCIEIPADMETGTSQNTVIYEDFLYQTFNSRLLIALHIYVLAY